MSASTTPFDVARNAIDECHKKDPAYKERVQGQQPAASDLDQKKDELSYADGVEKWASHLIGQRLSTAEFQSFASKVCPSSTSDVESITHTSELLKLGARCQHLERFLTPRSSYPEGKAGYLKWRRDLYTIQSKRASEILLQSGLSESDAEWVRKWVSKTELLPGKDDQGDLGTQLLEDAAVLVFLEEELEGFAQQHQDYTEQKMIDIIKKTWRKLSPLGKETALKLSMPKGLEPIVMKGIAAQEGTTPQEVEKEANKALTQDRDGDSACTSLASQSSSTANTAKLVPTMTESINNRKKQVSSSAAYHPSSSMSANGSAASQRVLRPKTAAEAEAMLAARAARKAAAGKTAEGAASTDTSLPVSETQSRDEEEEEEGEFFGARLLKSEEDIWTHNAWDHVEPPQSHYDMVETVLARQAETKLTLEEAEQYHNSAAGYWDTFYSSHTNRFFKDRKWLHLEFPELVDATLENAGPKTILEVGCGAGNTIFPLLEINQNPQLRIFGCDYSKEAVSVVRSNPLFSNAKSATTDVDDNNVTSSTDTNTGNDTSENLHSTRTKTKSIPPAERDVSVWDLSSTNQAELPCGLQPGSVDIIVLVFVFSALHPREWAQAVSNLKLLLKPKTGIILFRDYGRYDLPQLRFKKRRMLQDNFYLRGDGTRVYFFEPEELINEIFHSTPPPPSPSASFDANVSKKDDGEQEYLSSNDTTAASSSANKDFETLQMAIDRRLIVNRKEKKRMYRVWLQAKFRILS